MGYAVYVGVETMKANCGEWCSYLALGGFSSLYSFSSRFEADVVRQYYNVCRVCHCVTPPACALIIDRCIIAEALISASVTNWLAYK